MNQRTQKAQYETPSSVWQQRCNFLTGFADCDHLCARQEAPAAAQRGGTGGRKAAGCWWAAHPDQQLEAFALTNYTLQVLAGDVTRLSKQAEDYCFINTVECTYNRITSGSLHTLVFAEEINIILQFTEHNKSTQYTQPGSIVASA